MKIGCVANNTSPKAMEALEIIKNKYDIIDISNPKKRLKEFVDVIIVLGGDGFMLQILHRFIDRNTPIYGLNCGTIGFLLNSFSTENLIQRIKDAKSATLKPLSMYVRCVDGREEKLLAINDISLFRENHQAAKIRVSIDHVVRLKELICDGVLVSTPAGSTAYNFSAGGSIIPIGSNLIALTPLAPFRPRRWKGALLNHNNCINFEILEPNKRPVSAVADSKEIRNVLSVSISEQKNTSLILLFDAEHNFEERIIKEQFIH